MVGFVQLESKTFAKIIRSGQWAHYLHKKPKDSQVSPFYFHQDKKILIFQEPIRLENYTYCLQYAAQYLEKNNLALKDCHILAGVTGQGVTENHMVAVYQNKQENLKIFDPKSGSPENFLQLRHPDGSLLARLKRFFTVVLPSMMRALGSGVNKHFTTQVFNIDSENKNSQNTIDWHSLGTQSFFDGIKCGYDSAALILAAKNRLEQDQPVSKKELLQSLQAPVLEGERALEQTKRSRFITFLKKAWQDTFMPLPAGREVHRISEKVPTNEHAKLYRRKLVVCGDENALFYIDSAGAIHRIQLADPLMVNTLLSPNDLLAKLSQKDIARYITENGGPNLDDLERDQRHFGHYFLGWPKNSSIRSKIGYFLTLSFIPNLFVSLIKLPTTLLANILTETAHFLRCRLMAATPKNWFTQSLRSFGLLTIYAVEKFFQGCYLLCRAITSPLYSFQMGWDIHPILGMFSALVSIGAWGAISIVGLPAALGLAFGLQISFLAKIGVALGSILTTLGWKLGTDKLLNASTRAQNQEVIAPEFAHGNQTPDNKLAKSDKLPYQKDPIKKLYQSDTKNSLSQELSSHSSSKKGFFGAKRTSYDMDSSVQLNHKDFKYKIELLPNTPNSINDIFESNVLYVGYQTQGCFKYVYYDPSFSQSDNFYEGTFQVDQLKQKNLVLTKENLLNQIKPFINTIINKITHVEVIESNHQHFDKVEDFEDTESWEDFLSIGHFGNKRDRLWPLNENFSDDDEEDDIFDDEEDDMMKKTIYLK